MTFADGSQPLKTWWLLSNDDKPLTEKWVVPKPTYKKMVAKDFQGFFTKKHGSQRILLCRDFGVRLLLASVPTGRDSHNKPYKPNQKSPPKEGLGPRPQSHPCPGDLKVYETFLFAKMLPSGDWMEDPLLHPSHPSICLQDFVGDSRPPSGLFWSDTLSSKPSKAVPAAATVNPLRWRWGVRGKGGWWVALCCLGMAENMDELIYLYVNQRKHVGIKTWLLGG